MRYRLRTDAQFINSRMTVRTSLNVPASRRQVESAVRWARCPNSYRLGEPASEKEMRAAVRDVPFFNEMFDRLVEHLRAHEIDVQAKTVTLGPWLEVDRPNECFKDNAEANRLARGFYREPYAVPDLST